MQPWTVLAEANDHFPSGHRGRRGFPMLRSREIHLRVRAPLSVLRLKEADVMNHEFAAFAILGLIASRHAFVGSYKSKSKKAIATIVSGYSSR